MDVFITACVAIGVATSCSSGHGFYINSDTVVTSNHVVTSDITNIGPVVWRDVDADIAFIQAPIVVTSVPSCAEYPVTLETNNLFPVARPLWWSNNGWREGDSGRAFYKDGALVGINAAYWKDGGRDGLNFGVSCSYIKNTLTKYLTSFI